ncbi:hypothetical protein F383_22771 [Gossypium arboreum]|uniref:Uncharacterized protein n=1 Tax=Gossypium arboreum TaxID=29729 RepID=A0A0B0MNG7_GOSAR|nr:hypothetical protein F383_22771 [Gossypium arboreum]
MQVFYLLRTRFSYKYEQGQVRLFKSGSNGNNYWGFKAVVKCRAYKLVSSSLDVHLLLKALSPEDMPPQIETQDLFATMEGSSSADFLRSWWESKMDYTSL